MRTSNHCVAVVMAVLAGLAVLSVNKAALGDDDGTGVPIRRVNCPADSLQSAIDQAQRPTKIFVSGTCAENVTVPKDDLIISGNEAGVACDRADPSLSSAGTVEGTITVRGVRSRLEFLVVTGPGDGIDIFDRAAAELYCNDIRDNDETGINVFGSSNASLTFNKVRGNGQRAVDPFIFFDCGLFVGGASSVRSNGNTYEDNQYCAVEADQQSYFRNGSFLPVAPGHPPDPDERDVIVERDCDPESGNGCFTADSGPLAIEIFNIGNVDLRNAEVHGEIELVGLSSFRIDGAGLVQGNVRSFTNSIVRIRDRSNLGADRSVSFTGTLSCDATSLTFGSTVQCGQTCAGAIPGTCVP